jgi:hypothetical protein
MENANMPMLDPNYVPDELKTPYDIIELPSQGILYPNKLSSVKVEYLTAMDESILTSPNLASSGNMIDVLLKRKIKDLPFDPKDLLVGDRTAIIVFLRTTAFGEEYAQVVYNENNDSYDDGIINLNELKQKKLTVRPDDNGFFEFTFPVSKKKVTFKLITGKDEDVIDNKDKELLKRNNNEYSQRIVFTLEQTIQSIDGESDKLAMSNIIKKLTIKDSRAFRKYITEITPGLDFNTTARTPGGASVACFLRFNSSFFWPEI